MPISPQPAAANAPENAASEAAAQRLYIPELDALRFFAFFCVFLYHFTDLDLFYRTSLWSWPPGLGRSAAAAGSLGVDLFFTLSAYLITTLLLKERESAGREDVKSFYIRRLLRIWPLYYVFIAIAFALSYLGGEFTVGHAYLLSLVVFLGNIGIATAFDRSPRWHANLIVGPLWSVSIEEQFYLLWPIAMRRLSRRGIALAAAAILLFTFLDRLRGLWIADIGPPVPVITRLFHLDSFAVGILIAVVVPKSFIANLRLGTRALLFGGGIVAWIGAVHYGDYLTLRPTPLQIILSYPAVAIGAGAFLLSAIGSAKAGAQFMLNEQLRYLGKISYGLYVIHGFAITVSQIVVARMQTHWLGPLGFPVAFAVLLYLVAAFSLTVVISAASYRWLESPFLRLKDRFTHVPSRPV